MDWGVPYIIGNFLECKCLKWARMIHLDIWNTSYGQKKGMESNCQIWLLTTKSREIVQISLPASGMWHIIRKISMSVTTFFQTSYRSEVCTKCYGPVKSWESQLWEFRDSRLGVSGQNEIWVLAPWPTTKHIIKGKVVASPKLWWVLWVHVCPWLVLTPKTFKLHINQLVV